MLGGKLEERLTKEFGADLSKRLLKSGSEALVGPWEAAAEVAMDQIMKRKTSVKSFDDFADLVVEKSLAGGAKGGLKEPK